MPNLISIIAAVALMSTAISAAAEVQTYEFKFSDMLGADHVTDRSLVVNGRFTVDDRNGDGFFTIDEFKSFSANDTEFLNCPQTAAHRCEVESLNASTRELHRRQLRSFKTVDGVTRYDTMNEIEYYVGVSNDSGELLHSEQYYFVNGAKVTVTPVPEPASWLMLGAGAMVLVGAGRWRRPGQRRAPV